MGGVFGKEKPLKEQLRENKRMITRAIRELDREKRSLEKEEQRLTIEIKKMAKENQMKGECAFQLLLCSSKFPVILNLCMVGLLILQLLKLWPRTWYGHDSILPSLLK